jgi:tRNA(adenine34) deaminase
MHERYIQLALKEARKAASEGEVPIGALIVRDGRVVGRGRNRIERRLCATRHAELVAIESVSKKLGNWRLTGCTLYVTVEPCPMCASAASLARVERIVYGAPDELFGACGTVYRIPQEGKLKHAPKVEGGVLEAECRALMQSFFRKLRG